MIITIIMLIRSLERTFNPSRHAGRWYFNIQMIRKLWWFIIYKHNLFFLSLSFIREILNASWFLFKYIFYITNKQTTSGTNNFMRVYVCTIPMFGSVRFMLCRYILYEICSAQIYIYFPGLYKLNNIVFIIDEISNTCYV